LIEFITEIKAAWEEHNGWREDPMYDPHIDVGTDSSG
jgi:hypothetical protein